MFHDIHPHIFDNTFLEKAAPSDNDYIFHYQNDSVLLLKQDDGYTLPSRRDLKSHLREGELFLFS
ncbi:MAG TPA: NAD(+) diphosphatase, partial [Spirochaetota bacterium]|nr:NAD(+) diphosphatase [Spirochaetota bacterium]